MYIPVSVIESVSSVAFLVTGIISALIAYDFFMSKNGRLRKILICMFSSWSLHYTAVAVMLFTGVTPGTRVMIGACLAMLDFAALLSLYFYVRWRP